jgi:hypothetical protein
MNETLREMVEQNIFTRIAVAAVNQRKQDLNGMQELTALYVAMGWVSAHEVAEILGYAQEKLA